MANAIGGLIVYGVSEQRGAGEAKEVVGVDVAEVHQRQLRSLANTRIHPLMAGLQIEPLQNSDKSKGVLALSIPASSDAPHIIGEKAALGIPYRSGSDTFWMRERELERAYSDRFARRTAEAEHLTSLVEDVGEQLDLSRGVWIVGVAAPRQQRASVLAPPTGSDFTRSLEDSRDRTIEIAPRDQLYRVLFVPELGDAALNPRVGLRRWVAQTRRDYTPDELARDVHVQLHHDGTVGFATVLEGWYAPVVEGKHQVPCWLVESFIADLLAVASSYSARLGIQSPIGTRLEFRRPDNDVPLALVDYANWGSGPLNRLEQPSWSRTVRRFMPATAEFSVPATTGELRQAAGVLAHDVLSQFGMENLKMLP